MAEGDRARAVAAVLVNWNGFEDSVGALESLQRASPRPGFVILVDNGSTDGSPARLAQWARCRGISPAVFTPQEIGRQGNPAPAPWPEGLALILNPRNSGFGAGVNLGARLAAGLDGTRYLLLLNNDATVEPGFLAPLLAELEDPEVGAATGLIYQADRPGELWYGGGELDLLRALGVHHTGSPPPEPRDVDFISGCFALIKLDLFQRVGLLPETYFLYSEDVELSLLLKRAGYRLRLSPASVAYHKVNAAVGHWRKSPLVAYLHHRNRFWLVRRNLAPHQRLLSFAWLLPTRLGHCVAELSQGRAEIAREILRGTLHGLLGQIGDRSKACD